MHTQIVNYTATVLIITVILKDRVFLVFAAEGLFICSEKFPLLALSNYQILLNALRGTYL